MKFKKLLAVAAASALTVSALATSAFASLLVSPWGDTCTANGDTMTFTDAWAGGWIQFNNADETPFLSEDDFGKYDIVVNFKVDPADVAAAVGEDGDITKVLLFKMGDTSNENNAGYAVDGASEYTFVFPAADVNTQAAAGDDGKIYFGCNFQNGAAKKSEVTISYAEAGTVQNSNNASAAEAPAEETKAEEKPADENQAPAAGDTTQSSGNKGTADTGIEGVAVIAGVAIVAAGAVIVSKKRK